MPVEIVFHKCHVLARDRVRKDHSRLFENSLGLFDGCVYRSKVMSVDFYHMPVEALPFCGEVGQRHDVFDVAFDLDIVVVHDRGQIVQLVFCGDHHCLP